MATTNLEKIILEIVNDKSFENDSNKKEEFYKQKYPAFHKQFPMLLAKACENGFDYERFQWMMQMRTKVENNEITQYDASTQVGQKLVDTYVEPLLNK